MFTKLLERRKGGLQEEGKEEHEKREEGNYSNFLIVRDRLRGGGKKL